MTCALLTFGCRVNQAESLAIDRRLPRRPGDRHVAPERADLVIVNTCAVTADAERAARQAILRLGRGNPSVRIIVTGCFATRAPEALAALPCVVAVWDNETKEQLIAPGPGIGDEVGRLFASCAGWAGASADRGRFRGPGALGRTVALLRIQTGCDQHCSYCVVPLTRGIPASETEADVIARVGDASGAGYREIVLAGVHLGAWGRDLPGSPALVDLVQSLDRLDLDVRFRLSSIEPMDCPGGLVELVARGRRFVPHFHLPLQHVHDAVLARMRRPYGGESGRDLVETIRRRIPAAAIGIDLIAGFPGETEVEFESLARWLETAPVSYAHVFPYSPRPGTAATALGPRVSAHEVRRRVARLRSAAALRRSAFERSQLGGVREAITLGTPGVALTDNYLKVRIPPGRMPNERLRVRLTGCEPLAAELVAEG